MKHALTTAPILGYPKPDGQIILDTDASGLAVGAVLSQVQDGREVVLAYLSNAVGAAEQNYCVTRKELFAVVTACKAFHPYIYGRPVIVRTDNTAVAWAKRIKRPVNQMARWLQELGTYDLHEIHRPGRIHWNADALSRRPHAPVSSVVGRKVVSMRGKTLVKVSLLVQLSRGPRLGLTLQRWRQILPKTMLFLVVRTRDSPVLRLGENSCVTLI